jgi:transcriptional regulator with XRE-family HTH domain
VDAVRLGRTIRALRVRRGWRQQDLGDAAGVSQDEISLVERGLGRGAPLRTIERIVGALEAEAHIVVRWRGGDIDRLLDEGHAALMGRAIAVLEAAGWAALPEVTFAIYRDRGSMDVLAWHPATATVLVVEVKTELTSIEETLRTHDMKVRVAPTVSHERGGWRCRAVARMLVVPDTSTARRTVIRHGAVLGRVYPVAGHAARQWLRKPSGATGLILFLSPTIRGRGRCGPISRRRVRRPGAAVPERRTNEEQSRPAPSSELLGTQHDPGS